MSTWLKNLYTVKHSQEMKNLHSTIYNQGTMFIGKAF